MLNFIKNLLPKNEYQQLTDFLNDNKEIFYFKYHNYDIYFYIYHQNDNKCIIKLIFLQYIDKIITYKNFKINIDMEYFVQVKHLHQLNKEKLEFIISIIGKREFGNNNNKEILYNIKHNMINQNFISSYEYEYKDDKNKFNIKINDQMIIEITQENIKNCQIKKFIFKIQKSEFKRIKKLEKEELINYLFFLIGKLVIEKQKSKKIMINSKKDITNILKLIY